MGYAARNNTNPLKHAVTLIPVLDPNRADRFPLLPLAILRVWEAAGFVGAGMRLSPLPTVRNKKKAGAQRVFRTFRNPETPAFVAAKKGIIRRILDRVTA